MPAQRLPPAQPAYVLRGHKSQVHSVEFSHDNAYLLSGDAEGWVVCWGTIYKRALAVWKAHGDAVLGLAWCMPGIVISHGRDSKLVAWDLKQLEHKVFETILPVEGELKELKKPDILYELELNTLNFCAFAHCHELVVDSAVPAAVSEQHPILLAVPNIIDSEAIDIFQLPSTSRLATIPAPSSTKMGMVMALAIFIMDTEIVLVAGYESGHALVWTHPANVSVHRADLSRPPLLSETWSKLYESQPHTQPVLSLAISSDKAYFVTTSADAIVAKHPLSELLGHETVNAQTPLKTVQTKHSGQQGASMRSDGKIFATGGWDARVRVYSARTMKEVAVLKWHKDGCYATSFAHIREATDGHTKSLPSAANKQPEVGRLECSTTSDVKAGKAIDADAKQQVIDAGTQDDIQGQEVAIRAPTNIVAAQRAEKVKQTHWLAVGAKDGKVSLWDVF